MLDRFAHTLKHMGKERRRPESFTNEILMNLYDDAMIAGLPKDIAHEIELSKVMTTENDWLVYLAESKEYARAEGLKEGREEGREEGRQEGENNGIVKTARAMKANGATAEFIAKCTGLSAEEIAGL